jgi:hypothetical protein
MRYHNLVLHYIDNKKNRAIIHHFLILTISFMCFLGSVLNRLFEVGPFCGKHPLQIAPPSGKMQPLL